MVLALPTPYGFMARAIFSYSVRFLAWQSGSDRKIRLAPSEDPRFAACFFRCPTTTLQAASTGREAAPAGRGYLSRHYDMPDSNPREKFQIEILPRFDRDRR